MSWLQILVLGAAVGFGEIFPLSGSGISVPVRQLLGLPLDSGEDRLYSALLRIAVWLAVCLVLRRELWSCLRAFSSPPRHRGERVQEETRLHRRLALLLLLGTLPIIPALLIQDRATGLGTLPGVAVFLVLNGLLLFLTDRVGHGMRDVRSATVADGLCMGLAQALSIILACPAQASP
ncbi:MAG: undecaprenyl-diphosphate phosphatase [Oscillospiraceae bacterium]